MARALIAGPLRADEAAARVAETLGRPWRWLRPLAQRYVAAFAAGVRPRLIDVSRFVDDDASFRAAVERDYRRRLRGFPVRLRVAQRLAGSQIMQPVAAAQLWNLPPLTTVAELAEWLLLDVPELEWFADLKDLASNRAAAPALRHYTCRWVSKRSGGLRLLESPKDGLKSLQGRILSGILDRIPAHPAAHGFVRARNTQSFAAAHIGQHTLLRIDLQHFFPTIRRARVQALFRMLGYPESVADLLGGLVTTRTSIGLFAELASELRTDMRLLYRPTHLPQGAPTSPVLANLCCFRLDLRLAGLAAAAEVAYTRYADDLAFSGDEAFGRRVLHFAAHVGAVASEEGWKVNSRKTRVMRRGVRQHLTGLVVNARVNVPRAEYDRLKATLTNCVRNGPAAENRDGRAQFRQHLSGRVAFVTSINAARGKRLLELLERIDWT